MFGAYNDKNLQREVEIAVQKVEVIRTLIHGERKDCQGKNHEGKTLPFQRDRLSQKHLPQIV